MRESFKSFVVNIDILVNYINNHDILKGLINQLRNQNGNFQHKAISLQFNAPSMRVFEYNCYVISLYGYFEQFIESILTEYIDSISALHHEYNELPDEIKNNNIRKNADLLSNLELPKYRNIDAKSIIRMLHDNTVENKTNINTTAFCHHSTNFRIGSICEYFKTVGVNDLGKEISRYEPLKTHFEESIGDYSHLTLTKLYEVIDELVERRNCIAHGMMSDDILSTNRILEICTFTKTFAESLDIFLNVEILKRLFDESVHTSKKTFKKLETINVFNKEILCVKSNNLNISKGSNIIVESANVPSYYEAKILSIQVQGDEIESVTSEQSINIGLKLDKRIKITNSFYVVT